MFYPRVLLFWFVLCCIQFSGLICWYVGGVLLSLLSLLFFTKVGLEFVLSKSFVVLVFFELFCAV